MLFFLIFGTPLQRALDVSLGMVRIVRGIILMRIGLPPSMPPGPAGSATAGMPDRARSTR
jgi:hypothetical protein